MPQIRLLTGKMDLESDQTSRKDEVLAHLINGYRVGDSLYIWPAKVEHVDLGIDAPVYAWRSNLHNSLFAVCDGVLYRVANGVSTEITGTALQAGTPPTFTEDAYNVFVAANSPIYRITDNAAAEIAGGQAPVYVTWLAFVSGFLLANGTDPAGGGLAGDFAYSDTQGESGPTYAAWSYENNASKPDALQSLIATADDYLYAIGTDSVDVSYISGDASNPFASNKAAAQPFGTPARYSVAYDKQSIYYLSVIEGNRQIVRLVNGRDPQIIGFPVGVPVNNAERVDDARAFLMGFRGQTFYIIHFPTANVAIDDTHHAALTLAFNIRAEEWSILGLWDSGAALYDAYLGASFAYDGDTRYVGGNDGKIYTLTDEARDDEPIFEHKWRDDGNLEWGIARQKSLGTIGQRRTPLRSNQCGRYYKRQDEFVLNSGSVRMSIRTGWRSWGTLKSKTSHEYVYDMKRGDEGFVFNGVEERITVTR
jgi:hypothetical protein